MPHVEIRSRSLAKTISYRLIIMIFNMAIVFWFTRDTSITLDVSIVLGISSTVIYFFHERFWNQLHWGKRQHK